MTSDISKKISTVSIIAAIGVLYIHSYDVSSYSVTTDASNAVSLFEKWLGISLFGHSCVSLFFMISGYLFANGLNTSSDWVRKIKGRIKSLCIPYLFWAFFGWAIFFCCSSIPSIAAHMHMRATISANELYETFIALKYSHHLWYVQCLLIYCVLGLALHYIGNKRILSCIVVCGTIVLSMAGLELGFFHMTRFATFVIGFMIARWYPRCVEFSNNKVSVFALAALVLVSTLITIVNVPLIDRACYFVFPILMWLAYDCIKRTKFVRLTEKISKHSFYIYCGHGTFMECIKQAFCLLGDSWIIMLVSYALTPIITATILLVFLIVLKKVAPKVVSIVTGARS